MNKTEDHFHKAFVNPFVQNVEGHILYKVNISKKYANMFFIYTTDRIREKRKLSFSTIFGLQKMNAVETT